MALSNKKNPSKIVLVFLVIFVLAILVVGAIAAGTKISNQDSTIIPTEASPKAVCGNNICEENEYVPCPEGAECLWAGSCPQDCEDKQNNDTAELNCGFCGMNCIALTGAEICPMVMPEEGMTCEKVTHENGKTECVMFKNDEMVESVNDDLDQKLDDKLTMVKSGYDLNDDGKVSIKDFVSFAPLYIKKDPKVDFNADGKVDVSDFTKFASEYKKQRNN